MCSTHLCPYCYVPCIFTCLPICLPACLYVCLVGLCHVMQCEVWSGTEDDVCLHLRVNGFSDKALLLLQQALAMVMSYATRNPDATHPIGDTSDFLTKDTPEGGTCRESGVGADGLFCSQISRQLEVLLSYYANASITAGTASRSLRLNHLMKNKVPLSSRLKHLESIKQQLGDNVLTMSSLALDVQAFVRQFLQASRAVGLMQGNIAREAAVAFGQHCEEILNSNKAPFSLDLPSTFTDATITATTQENARAPASAIRHLPVKSFTLPPFPLHALPSNPLETNIAVELYFQLGSLPSVTITLPLPPLPPTASTSGAALPLSAMAEEKELELRQLVLLELLDQVVAEPFFDSLRTNQQVSVARDLGYV